MRNPQCYVSGKRPMADDDLTTWRPHDMGTLSAFKYCTCVRESIHQRWTHRRAWNIYQLWCLLFAWTSRWTNIRSSDYLKRHDAYVTSAAEIRSPGRQMRPMNPTVDPRSHHGWSVGRPMNSLCFAEYIFKQKWTDNSADVMISNPWFSGRLQYLHR